MDAEDSEIEDERAVDDPWEWLNYRYENDEVARFTVMLGRIETKGCGPKTLLGTEKRRPHAHPPPRV